LWRSVNSPETIGWTNKADEPQKGRKEQTMSDSTAPSEGNTDVSEENTGGFKPVTIQEDLDRIIENRLVRERKKLAG